MTTREAAEQLREGGSPLAPEPLPRFVTIKQAAAILGVSDHTVWRKVRDGKIRAVQIGRIYRINVEHLTGDLEYDHDALARAGRSASARRRSPAGRQPKGEYARRARGLEPL